MTREEYLAQLRALLTGRTPPDELERILAYYTEYFDEAGPQGEGRVIRELGTPAELVGRVLGAQRSRTVPAERDCPPEGAARERHGLGTLWKVLLAICAAPIAIPLILVVVAMVLGLVVLILALVAGVAVGGVVAIGAVILGAMMVISPAILQPFTRKITNTDDLALGHFGSIGYLLSALVGKIIGKGSPSIEEIKVPKSLNFLRDSSVAISLTMMILFLVLVLVAGKSFVEETLSAGQNFIIFAIIQSLTFAAGVYIILAGVRMVIAEIVPAFKGIADKLVKDAKPALDCPTVFPFAPNAVIVGFLASFVAGLVSMFLCPLFGLSVIVPGLVPHFFCGATAGVYGNITGGRRGAVVGAFAHGLLISFLPAILLPMMGDMGLGSTTFGDADFGVVGIVLGHIIAMFN